MSFDIFDGPDEQQGFEKSKSELGDNEMARAMLVRLLHRCHVVNIHGVCAQEEVNLSNFVKYNAGIFWVGN